VLGQTKIIATSDQLAADLCVEAGHEDNQGHRVQADVVLAQVLIEAVILEVALNNSQDLGFSYLQHPQNSGNGRGWGDQQPELPQAQQLW